MIDFLVENQFVLLFLVLGLGYLVGRIHVAGFGLGVSAVLFVGLGFGALSPRISLPEFVYQLGLIVFVYTVGVSAGPGFVDSLRRRALGANLMVALVLVSAALLAAIIGHRSGLSQASTAGVFAGATTNTPALAAVLQYQEESDDRDPERLTQPVLGYSVAYPYGVLGTIIGVWAARRRWRPAHRPGTEDDLVDLTVRVTSPSAAGRSVAELMREHHWSVVISRVRRGGEAEVPDADFVLERDDLVVVVGPSGAADSAAAALGERSAEALPLDRSELDARRMFVSASEPIGRRIGELGLIESFGAIVTRVRRGDADHLARADTVLEPGDRVRIVAPRDRMADVTRFFGDSYRVLSEIDVAAFSLGIVAGLLVGLIPLPIPGGGTFRLGMAGGPLVVGLILGALERTGPITWQLPFNANLTLRQFGAVLFLAGVGVRSGDAFVHTLGSGDGLVMLCAGVAITSFGVITAIWIGHAMLRIPVDVLCGVVAGMHTQPAVLAFAVEQADDDLPNNGYASVYPVATIAKIVLAQLLLII